MSERECNLEKIIEKMIDQLKELNEKIQAANENLREAKKVKELILRGEYETEY